MRAAPSGGAEALGGHDLGRVPVRSSSQPAGASSELGASPPGSSQPIQTYDKKKRARIDAWLRDRPQILPSIGVSNRPAFGYDSSALGSRLATGRSLIRPESLPHGFGPLDREATKREEAERKEEVQVARTARLVPQRARGSTAVVGSEEERESERLDLDERARGELGRVSGLYVGGGQDFDPEDQPTRLPYERALIREARNRGLPTLAICGGSRVLAQEFGGCAAELDPKSVKLHQRHKTNVPAHPLSFPDPSTFLGGITGGRPVDAINSTHEKVVRHEGGELSPINQLPGVRTGPRSELAISALGPDGHPEGFETRFGAPIVGVTSHPEAIFGTRGARESATGQGRYWSDRVLGAFAQSARSFAARQAVNQELLARVRTEPPAAQSHPPVTLPPELAAELEASRLEDVRHRRPEIQFGAPLSKFRDRGFKEPGRL